MSLSLPLALPDYAGFFDAFTEFIDTHYRLIRAA